MTGERGYRLSFWRGMFFLLLALGIGSTIARFIGGLGEVTNLTDKYPWGIWKAFNVLVAIGLGGAGFTIMGVVYVFNLTRFKPIVRPTVLMAFLAYLSSAISLFVDIGKSWSIWHPIVMWNTHSVLFEVAWCLMLYTAVLVLEGSGMVFERLGWKRMLHIQHMITVPIVILGVILSTLHQSSLGALFLIVPGKLHALWYSETLPLLFFVSAICMGLSMVIVLSRLSARAFGRTLEMPILTGLGKILLVGLMTWGAMRVYDLVADKALRYAFQFTYEAALFQVEFILGIMVPALILVADARRKNPRWLYSAALCTVLGFITYRLNVSITGLEAQQGGHYVPAWSELFFTLMMVALAFGGYALGVRYLPVYPEVTARIEEQRARRLVEAGAFRNRLGTSLASDN